MRSLDDGSAAPVASDPAFLRDGRASHCARQLGGANLAPRAPPPDFEPPTWFPWWPMEGGGRMRNACLSEETAGAQGGSTQLM